MNKTKKALFWVHYQRKADGQDFHERLDVGKIKKLLSRGGITLCGMETASREGEA